MKDRILSSSEMLHFTRKLLIFFALPVVSNIVLNKIWGMTKGFLLVAMCLAAFISSRSQDKMNRAYRNFPVIITINFHSLTLPFRDFKSNFSNVGFGLGTEVSFNGKQDWVQQFSINWNRNEHVGNGLLISTQ